MAITNDEFLRLLRRQMKDGPSRMLVERTNLHNAVLNHRLVNHRLVNWLMGSKCSLISELAQLLGVYLVELDIEFVDLNLKCDVK